jgi:integrase
MPPPPLSKGHASPHVNCPLCESTRKRTIEPAAFGLLRFSQAGPYWLNEHRPQIAAKTILDYEYYLRALTQFLGELPLNEIHIGHVEQYQEWRQQPYVDANSRTRSAGPSAINHEVNTLAQILERAGLWIDIKRWYHPLKVPKARIGKALTPEEEERLFYVAAADPRWEVAYLAELLSANTSAGPGEIRHLRICDVDLQRTDGEGTKRPSISVVEGIKNEFRARTIALNPTAVAVVQRLIKRYQRLLNRQGVEPDRDHYLLPGRARTGRNNIDFFKPQLKWWKAWHSICKRAGIEVRPYDMRHHCITKMLEDPTISERVVKETAGHVSKRILDRYSHIRDQAQREAVTAVETARLETDTPAHQLALNFDAPTPQPKPANVVEFADVRKVKKA